MASGDIAPLHSRRSHGLAGRYPSDDRAKCRRPRNSPPRAASLTEVGGACALAGVAWAIRPPSAAPKPAAQLAAAPFVRYTREWWQAGVLLSLCTASHGVLDALTDAGRGIAFFLPFDSDRYFFPWRPLATSPLSISRFFSGPALEILWNELLWVWLPLGSLATAVRAARHRRA